MNYRICQIDGDGIGPEVVPVAINSLKRLIPDLKIATADAGWGTFQDQGDSVPKTTLKTIRDCGAAIFGAVSSPSRKVDNYQSAILKIRQSLDLFANIRPVDSRFGNRSDRDFRFVVVRENSEGLYARIEQSDGKSAFAKKVVTQKASQRIGKMALQIARRFGIHRITIAHKANVLPETDGLFLSTVRATVNEQKASGEKIIVDDQLVDSCALKIVENPEAFGVIVTTNLYGDILSDVAAYWCGGLQLAPSVNLGAEIAVCEPVHGSAPDIAGRGIADPRAALLSLALLCRLHWNQPSIADEVECAVIESLSNDHEHSSTREIASAITQAIDSIHHNV